MPTIARAELEARPLFRESAGPPPSTLPGTLRARSRFMARGGNAPIRVGFVLHGMQVAGAEVLVAESIRRLGDLIEPMIICLDYIGELGEEMLAEGVPVVCLRRRPGRDLGLAWRLARMARRRRLKILHAHQYTPFFYAALARALGAPTTEVVLTEHGRHYPDVVAPIRRRVNQMLLSRLASAVTGVSAFSAEGLARTDGFASERIEVIENGVDLEPYAPVRDLATLRRRLELDADRRYLLCVARFHPVKDHGTLIDAFGRLAAHHPDVDLLLAGDGPERARMEAKVREMGLDPRVRFLGVRGDVPDLLRGADVFVLSSVSEAAPLTVMEAMAARLPVVATNVGGTPELLQDGVHALLAPRGDSAALAQAIGATLDDPGAAERRASAAFERIRSVYSLDRTIARYYHLYARLAGRRGGTLPSWPEASTPTGS